MNNLSTFKVINIQKLKHSFTKKFPDSETTKILLSMPDEIEAEELIGAVAIWLTILDMESAKYIGGGK
jgi:hypothetical protein